MMKKELTVQEANELCIQALILLSHQNRNQKHKTMKKSWTSSRSLSRKGSLTPNYSAPLQPHFTYPQSPLLLSQLTSQKTPKKQDDQPFGKNSLVEVATWKDLSQFSIEKFPEATHRDENQLFSSLGGPSCQMEVERVQGLNQLQNSGRLTDASIKPEQDLLPQGRIKELKRDLQIKSRGKICKTQDIDPSAKQLTGYHLICKSDPDCPFHCILQIAGTTLKGQKLFRVITECDEHLKECYEDEQEINFLKLTKLIDVMEEPIRQLLAKNEEMKPKDVLVWLAGELGHADHRFIYQGLKCKTYHKSAKKYFDNLVYRIKNPLWA